MDLLLNPQILHLQMVHYHQLAMLHHHQHKAEEEEIRIREIEIRVRKTEKINTKRAICRNTNYYLI